MVGLTTWLSRPSTLPLRVYGTVLVLAFLVEVSIMLLLPSVVEGALTGLHTALIDALLLTTVLAPAVWFVVARPLKKLHDDRGQLLARVFESQEAERCAVARDLHDELGQHLTALRLAVRGLERATTLEQAKTQTRTMNELVSTSLESVHVIAKGLRPAVLEEFGLVPAVERFCEECHRNTGIELVVEMDIVHGRRFDPAIETCIFRVLQETLTNVARHANASRVEVALSQRGHTLELCVADNGIGFVAKVPSATSQSFGLQGMRERAELADGRITVDSSPGTGTTVTLLVPAGS